MEEISEKEKRIKSITKIYYSNPKVQGAIFNFAKNREVVPRYFEGFGKRPDTIQYPADIMNLVNKGATSFHASEEIWHDVMKISSDLSQEELSEIRNGWDLLIDIDSPFLDYSKIAARVLIEELENHGVKNYGIKFSGSKGMHIIVSSKAFPENFRNQETKKMFPEFPRAICEYLMFKIRPKYNKEVTKLESIDFKALKERTNLTKEEVTSIVCPNCGEQAKKTNLVNFQCEICGNQYARPNYKITKKKLKCNVETCPGHYEVIGESGHFFCDKCKTKSSINLVSDSNNKIIFTRDAKKSQAEEFKEEILGEKIASLDLVLVAPRHLFRMPYSLHEKTALSSIVITKDQIQDFNPQDANPFKISPVDFIPLVKEGEASYLLESALNWKKGQEEKSEAEIKKKYSEFKAFDFKNVPEELFPQPIKKLLKGISEGRKRGLFILLTFLRSLNFSPEYLNIKIREWNKLNSPPLKEGYVKSQIDWHLRQKKKILPPNYSNQSFYKDLNLLDTEPREKNPVVEVMKKLRRNESKN